MEFSSPFSRTFFQLLYGVCVRSDPWIFVPFLEDFLSITETL